MKRSFRLSVAGGSEYNNTALEGGGVYNEAALDGGGYYNNAALIGGSTYNNAALRGGKGTYNNAALRGGKKTYNDAALRGGKKTYNDAALRGGKKTYNDAALRGGKKTYNDAALRGGAATYTDAALLGGKAFYNEAALEGGAELPATIMLGEHICEPTYNEAALLGGKYIEPGHRGDYGAFAVRITPYNDAALVGGAALDETKKAIMNEAISVGANALKLAVEAGANPAQQEAAIFGSILANAHAIDNSATGEQAHAIARAVAEHIARAGDVGRVFANRAADDNESSAQQYLDSVAAACNYIGNVAGEAGRIAGVNTEQQKRIDDLVTQTMKMYTLKPKSLKDISGGFLFFGGPTWMEYQMKKQNDIPDFFLNKTSRERGQAIGDATRKIFNFVDEKVGRPVDNAVKDWVEGVYNGATGHEPGKYTATATTATTTRFDNPTLWEKTKGVYNNPNTWTKIGSIASGVLGAAPYVLPIVHSVYENFISPDKNKKKWDETMMDALSAASNISAYQAYRAQKAREDNAPDTFWSRHGNEVVNALQSGLSKTGKMGAKAKTWQGALVSGALGLAAPMGSAAAEMLRPTDVHKGLANQMWMSQVGTAMTELAAKKRKREALEEEEKRKKEEKEDRKERYRLEAETEARGVYNVNPKSGVPQKRIKLRTQLAPAKTKPDKYINPAMIAVAQQLNQANAFNSLIYNPAAAQSRLTMNLNGIAAEKKRLDDLKNMYISSRK